MTQIKAPWPLYYRWEPIPDPPYANPYRETKLTSGFVSTAEKSKGQIAHETFHAELELRGLNSRACWDTLPQCRKAGWEAAAKAVVDERKKEEFASACSVKLSPAQRLAAFEAFRAPLDAWAEWMDGPSCRRDPLYMSFHCDGKEVTQRVPIEQTFSDYASKALLDLAFNKTGAKTMQENNEDKLKGAQFEIEELRTEVSNLNDELSETRLERETLRAELDRVKKAPLPTFHANKCEIDALRAEIERLKKATSGSFAKSAEISLLRAEVERLKSEKAAESGRALIEKDRAKCLARDVDSLTAKCMRSEAESFRNAKANVDLMAALDAILAGRAASNSTYVSTAIGCRTATHYLDASNKFGEVQIKVIQLAKPGRVVAVDFEDRT